MEELWAADRATSGGVRTARQARRIRHQSRVDVNLNNEMDYIPDAPTLDSFDAYPPTSPPHMDEYGPGPTQFVPSVPSGGTSTSRGSKRKAPMVNLLDSQFDKLSTKLDGFMDVMESGNTQFEKMSYIAERQVIAIEKRNDILSQQVGMLRRNATFQYTESDIWEMLEGMNIQDPKPMDQCYDFLCTHPMVAKMLMGMPANLRWSKLLNMMMGGK